MMLRRLAALVAVLLTAVLVAACGSQPHAKTVTARERVTTQPVSPSGLPRETSRTPEGAKPALPPVGVALAASLQKHISANGLHLIEGFEGFSSCPYWDAYGHVETRGYGETEGIHAGSPCITRAYGEQNLRSRLERFYEWALRALGVPLNQNQWDALDSFAWNLGAGIFQGTTLGAELRARQFNAAASNMLQYVHAGGVVLAGLVTRRRAEVRLFLTPIAGPTPAQARAAKVRSLHTQEGLRRALHADIGRHHCRPGQHATPSSYHTVCGQWLREGDAAIRVIGKSVV